MGCDDLLLIQGICHDVVNTSKDQHPAACIDRNLQRWPCCGSKHLPTSPASLVKPWFSLKDDVHLVGAIFETRDVTPLVD